MPKVTLPKRFEAKIDAKRDRALLPGIDENGNSVDLELPLGIIMQLAENAKQAAAIRTRLAEGPLEHRGQWKEVVPLVYQTLDVGSLVLQNAPTVVLIFDRGLSTEMAFPLTPEQAKTIAGHLTTQSERCKTLDPKTSN